LEHSPQSQKCSSRLLSVSVDKNEPINLAITLAAKVRKGFLATTTAARPSENRASLVCLAKY
jgi:hypothetical protein